MSKVLDKKTKMIIIHVRKLRHPKDSQNNFLISKLGLVHRPTP